MSTEVRTTMETEKLITPHNNTLEGSTCRQSDNNLFALAFGRGFQSPFSRYLYHVIMCRQFSPIFTESSYYYISESVNIPK